MNGVIQRLCALFRGHAQIIRHLTPGVMISKVAPQPEKKLWGIFQCRQLIILAIENDRQFPLGRHVEGFVHYPLEDGAFTKKGNGNMAVAAYFARQGHPRAMGYLCADNAVGAH